MRTIFELERSDGRALISVFLYADGLRGFSGSPVGGDKPPLFFRNVDHMRQFAAKHNYNVSEFETDARNT